MAAGLEEGGVACRQGGGDRGGLGGWERGGEAERRVKAKPGGGARRGGAGAARACSVHLQTSGAQRGRPALTRQPPVTTGTGGAAPGTRRARAGAGQIVILPSPGAAPQPLAGKLRGGHGPTARPRPEQAARGGRARTSLRQPGPGRRRAGRGGPGIPDGARGVSARLGLPAGGTGAGMEGRRGRGEGVRRGARGGGLGRGAGRGRPGRAPVRGRAPGREAGASGPRSSRRGPGHPELLLAGAGLGDVWGRGVTGWRGGCDRAVRRGGSSPRGPPLPGARGPRGGARRPWALSEVSGPGTRLLLGRRGLCAAWSGTFAAGDGPALLSAWGSGSGAPNRRDSPGPPAAPRRQEGFGQPQVVRLSCRRRAAHALAANRRGAGG